MSSSGNIVKLDIGGTVFKTSRSTLTKYDGFFKTILETDVPVTKDESGAIFVDRSPKHFDLILNYMRDGHVAIPASEQELQEIQTEAQYYLLTGLVELCKSQSSEQQSDGSPKWPDIITLNVRGSFFQVSKPNLIRISGPFKEVLEGKNSPISYGYKALIDDSGAIFIDRSPKHFHQILDFMRDGSINAPKDQQEIQEILGEARAYRLAGLIKWCEYQLKDFIYS